MMIEINNLTTLSGVDKKFLKGVAKTILKGENTKEAGLSVVLVSSGRIKKLNKKYRGKNKITDVLAFGEGLNEIVICPSEVKKNAKKYNIAFKKELARVLIHGILHLSGYEHEVSEKKAREMERKQEFYLSQII